MIRPEFPPVQGRCANCPSMNRGTKISLALGIISLIGGVLATCYPLQFLSTSHWLFYTGCTVTALSVVAFALAVICARFFSQRSATPRIEPEEIIPTQGPRTYAINNGTISITLSQSELRTHPQLHLNRLAEQIERHVNTSDRPRLRVVFNGQEGVDSGGLTAIYFNDLVSGIVSKKSLFKQLENSSYYLPNPEPDQNLQALEQLGKMMMFCYSTFVIGDYFDLSLFAVALSFSCHELDQPFDSLSNLRKVALYQILIDKIGEEVLPAYRRMLECLRLGINSWSEDQLIEAIRLVDALGLMPRNLLNAEDEPNIDLIKKNKQLIKNALFTVAGHLYGRQIRGIHAIAKGMRSVYHKGPSRNRSEENNRAWQQLCRNTSPEVFNELLQGSIDREFIIQKIEVEHLYNGIRFSREIINQKVVWLKGWIRNGATPDKDIRAFLKYVTGSTSLPKHLPRGDVKGKITVKWQSEEESRSHLPRSSTCFNILYLSPEYHIVKGRRIDGTLEGFILSLKEAIEHTAGLVLRD